MSIFARQTHPSAGQEAPAINIKGVDFSYVKNETVLQNINLEMPQGGFVAVLGPNGGGKTTLLKLILGLLEPDCGSIRVFGKNPEQARGNIGYVPQFSTINTSFPATVLDTMLMGAAVKSPLRGVRWNTDKKAVNAARELLQAVGMEGLERAPVNALSGGQRQRVLVARALMGKRARPANEPFLLILDEPTANVDPEGKCCFYEFIRNAGHDVSIMVVSHDLALAALSSSLRGRDCACGAQAAPDALAPVNASGRANPFSSIAIVNKTLTLSEEMHLHPDVLRAFFGQHDHDCLIAGMVGPNMPHSADPKAP